MSEPTPWHRLFGLTWMDFFRGLPVEVEVEKDLSVKQQLLDVVFIRKDANPLPCRLPDGFEELAPHNLISFKSYQEALDGWALLELMAHYVNYRKQTSPTMQELLPETDFRLFAVSVRFPQGLAQDVALKVVCPGVYEVNHFTGVLRLIVVHELPQKEHNAFLHLFSVQKELVLSGATHHQLRSSETSSLLKLLYGRYRLEEPNMADLLAQIHEQMTKEYLESLPIEERLKGIPAEERLKGLSVAERLQGLSPDELLAALPPEVRAILAQRSTPAVAKGKEPEASDPTP